MTSPLFPSEQEGLSLIVGPDSVSWRYVSDTRLYVALLYPLLLLQVAHPTVGAGVRDFSNFDERPWNRLMRHYAPLASPGDRGRAPEPVVSIPPQPGSRQTAARARHVHPAPTSDGVGSRTARIHD